MTFGDRLRELRIRARLDQTRLADLAGVSRAAISLLERGQQHPRPDTLQLLARGLATDTDGIVNKEREKELFLDLYRAAGHPLPDALATSSSSGLDALMMEYPELRAELALYVAGRPKPEDAAFLAKLIRLDRERTGGAQ